MINEKFKELYSEAAAYAFDQRFIASPDGPRELMDVINEKFAELIVRDVVATVKSTQITSPDFEWVILNNYDIGVEE